MKIKLDENLPPLAGRFLAEAGHDVDSTHDEDLNGESDDHVFVRATADDRLLVTLDRGFGDVRAYTPGTHAGIVVLRLAEQSLENVETAFRALATCDLGAWAGAIVIYRDGEIRVRWPPSTTR